MTTSDAILRTLQSPNVADSNFEAANVVDVLQFLANACGNIGRAITPRAAPGRDAGGGTVESLTEAVMGVTGGLHAIANAIEGLSDAVREGRGDERHHSSQRQPGRAGGEPG